MLGALCCLLGAVALASARVNPFDPRHYDPFGGSGVTPGLLPVPPVDVFHGYNEPVSVCATHYTPGPYADSRGGTCSQNDVVFSISDTSRAWVTFSMGGGALADDPTPATVYLRRHNGHWRSFVTCGEESLAGGCALPLRSIFQAVSLTLRAGMTYDVGVYVNPDGILCSAYAYPSPSAVCPGPPAQPALPLSFTVTR